MVRQHQQNVAVVSVPEANQFFVTPVADRLALLGRLQLHSLLEYIDQLEAYRQAGLNRLKIAAFNRQYYAMLLGKAASSSSLKASKADQEQSTLAIEDAKLTGQAGVLLGQLEAKLEALQLKRMMEATVNSFGGGGGGGGRSSITSITSLSDLFNLQQSDYLQQLEIDSNEGSGGVESEEVKHLPPNQEEQKQEDEEEEEELVEVIDLTRLVDELVADGDAGKPKEKQVKLETPIWANWSATPATKETYASTDDAAAAEDEKLIEKLQAKVRLLEAELAAQKKEEEEDSKKHTFATPTKASSTLRNFNSPKQSPSEEVPLVGGKLCLGGHQLPLPAAYNRLALVEKSLLLAPLGEALRGHYLNLCWQEAIAGKLAKKAFFSGAAT